MKLTNSLIEAVMTAFNMIVCPWTISREVIPCFPLESGIMFEEIISHPLVF